jgi:carboxyl-terminal processing protease
LPARHRPRATLAALCAALALCGCASGLPKPFVPTPTTPNARAAGFDAVAQMVQQRYVDPQFNGVDWAAVQARYRQRVLQAPDDESYWAELNRMVGELRDAHTRVLSPMDLKATRMQRGFHGVSVEAHNGRWWVTGVAGQLQAALLGVRPGQEVLAVDDQPVAAWWQQQLAQAPGSSTPRAQELLVNRALNRGAVGSERRLTLRGSDGQQRTLRLRIDPGFLPEVRAHKLADGTGYLRFNGFQPALASELRAAIEYLADSQRLVLDLRGNPGGSQALTMQLLGWFLPPGSAGRVITRDNQRLTALLGLLDVTPKLDIPAQPQRLSQPMAVLVDQASASGAELMAGVLQAKGRARLFGSTSCGCLLAVRGGEDLPGGGRLVLSEVDLSIDNRIRVEGVGIQPDEPVWADPASALLGDDKVLAAARRWLATPLPPSAAATPGAPGNPA